jgi:hypothetical protein
MTPVGCPVGVSERGPLGLGREGEGLVLRHSGSAQVELASLDLSEEKEKRTSGTPLFPSTSVIWFLKMADIQDIHLGL